MRFIDACVTILGLPLISVFPVLANGANPPQSLVERVQVTAVRVNVVAHGEDGKPVTGFAPADVEVLEDGVPAQVLGVEPLVVPEEGKGTSGARAGARSKYVEGPAARSVAVYIVPELCGRRSLSSMLDVLERGAASLASLGPVTVVSANPEPRQLATALTDARKINAAIRKISRAVLPESRLEQARRDFQRDLVAAHTAEAKLARARAAVYEERAILRSAFGSLMSWSAARSPEAGRVLVLGISGFDVEPEDYYYDVLAEDPDVRAHPRGLARAQEELRALRFTDLVTEAAAALATQGWTVLTIDAGRTVALFANAAEQSGHGRLNAFTPFRRGELQRSNGTGSTPFYFLHPRDSLLTLAEDTGGALIPPNGSIAAALAGMRGTFVLTYQVDRPPDGRRHALEVRSRRAGLTVTAPRVVMSGTPEAVAAERARRVLEGSAGRGVIPLQATVTAEGSLPGRRKAGRFAVKVDLGRFADLVAARGRVRLRVTVAVELKGQQPFIVHEEHDAAPERGAPWLFDAPIEWPSQAHRVAVAVEELATGEWGAVVTELP